VENKKINVFFYLVVIFFLMLIYILIKDSNDRRINDNKEYRAIVSSIVTMENYRIATLAKENADLKNALANARNRCK